jgi:hypothetical protein
MIFKLLLFYTEKPHSFRIFAKIHKINELETKAQKQTDKTLS